ncbi:MAG: transposase [Mesorhizobium sp.]|nr:MAG: transposase [Mesorhizobium sp.]
MARPRLGGRVDTELREVLNAIRYIAHSGGGWRMPPKDFPPRQPSTGGSAASSGVSCSR